MTRCTQSANHMGKRIKRLPARKEDKLQKLSQKHVRKALAALRKRRESECKKKCFRERETKRSPACITLSTTYMTLQLRKYILRHDWIAAARLLPLILNEGTRNMIPYLMKVCLLTLMHHPNSTPQLRKDFIRIFDSYKGRPTYK